ncbi:MAG: site-specific DNA-methyltransferase [Chitinophagales bacterium]|nr:site-specific DNA-methyltransferase [Chitinophagales bacterium]
MKKVIQENKVYNECCLQTMNKMPDSFIDLTITSPPYDDLRTYNNHIKGIKSEYNGFSFQFENIAKELFRVTKEGGVVVWIVSDATTGGNETGNSFRQALYFKECGFQLFDTMIYSKPPRGAVGNNTTYWQSFEYMFVFAKGRPKTINLLTDRENKESRKGDNGTKRLQNGELLNVSRGGYGEFGRRTNIWEYNIGKGHSSSDNYAYEHPAIFPEKLARDHIISWSNPGEIVYDPMIGSGTVAKMAVIENRLFIGSEINKNYCDICEQRIELAYQLTSMENYVAQAI